MALLVEIAYSYVSGVATKNFLCLSFVNWDTTGSCLIFTFYLSFWGMTSLSGSDWWITFWWRYGSKQVSFRNYILDNTLDNDTPDGDNNFDDNNDDNNNHNSDDNNDDNN